MNAILLWIGCAALLLVAAGLELWRRSHVRAHAQATSAFIDQQLAHAASRHTAQADGALRTQPRRALPWEFFFERAGVAPSPSLYMQILIPAVLLTLAMGFSAGPLSAGVVLVLYTLLVVFRYWLKAARRYRAIVRQLPAFLDGMVRMLTIGNSLPAAFQTSAGNSEAPLRDLLERAARQVQAGVDLDVALRQIARVHRVDEIYLFAAVVDLSTRFGGRADQILSRMASFMRDREQAQKELVAMSSETRMSAWVLSLLPIGVGAMLMLLNPAFFEPMLHEPDGQKMLLAGLGMEVLGGFLLYRLAQSI
ncbi:pilus assembly protein TadB [Pandoraea terrae]|uniref:Pilus assembly protein TadB n=1 Tax=Pandoraea terrae TaxID=1537710 RepID=A0A5E4Z5Q8_9BURK|nr:type II secretion system F family protein [Pandoraea terrae]VVE56571.1 pilus assembly protein TadB [Pandoraea terrae]